MASSAILTDLSECSSAWLERYVRDVEVASSNLVTPTIPPTFTVSRIFGYFLSHFSLSVYYNRTVFESEKTAAILQTCKSGIIHAPSWSSAVSGYKKIILVSAFQFQESCLFINTSGVPC